MNDLLDSIGSDISKAGSAVENAVKPVALATYDTIKPIASSMAKFSGKMFQTNTNVFAPGLTQKDKTTDPTAIKSFVDSIPKEPGTIASTVKRIAYCCR